MLLSEFHLGYHCSHEQFWPSHLLRLAQQAEQAGFTQASSSDHFMPWSEQQGESGFVWSWLGAVLQATTLGFGVVNAPGQRYHPAIIAQAVATLLELFPHRFWLAVGSGQLLNEHITGTHWPDKGTRNARLLESVELMRALWRGETVTHRGLITVQEAKLYTLPPHPPLVVGAAITAGTAEWLGGWADALITTSRPPEQLQPVLDAFRRGGGAGKPVYLKVQLSYDTTFEKAQQGAHEQWRNNVFDSALLSEVPTPQSFDAAGQLVKPDELAPSVLISDSLAQHAEWLEQFRAMGISHLYLHNVNRAQEQFIDAFGAHVLPQLR